MNSQSRKDHWQSVYENNTPTAVSWFQKEPTLSLHIIKNTGIAHNKPIIDIGGGASLLVDRLQDRGYSNLSVLDISSKSLKHARQRLGKRSETIEWLTTDVSEFIPPQQYFLWHDRAVFHFLTNKSDRKKYIKTLEKSVHPKGHIIIATFAIGGPTKCSGLDIVQYDEASLLVEFEDKYQLVSHTSETHVTPGGGKQQFSYFRLKKSR